jgi:hypothetical protein
MDFHKASGERMRIIQQAIQPPACLNNCVMAPKNKVGGLVASVRVGFLECRVRCISLVRLPVVNTQVNPKGKRKAETEEAPPSKGKGKGKAEGPRAYYRVRRI